MATATLMNALSFVAVAPAATAIQPHRLNRNGVGIIPDLLLVTTAGNFVVSANAVNVTVTNNGGVAGSVDVYAIAWHSIVRVLPPGVVNLTPQPFISGGSGAGAPGPLQQNVTSIKVGAYPAVIDDFVRVNPTGGAFIVTLPTAIGVSGRQISVKNVSASANTVTVATSLGQTIDGAATFPITSAFAEVNLMSDGANWMAF